MILLKKFVDRYYLILLILIFLFGAVLRIYYLLDPVTKLSFDEATYALQAFNILNGERSVFYYNQPYTGTLQAYLTAAFYFLFGVNEIWAKLVPFYFSIVYLFLTYILSYILLRDKYLSLLALIFASFSTSFWLNWSSRAGSGYNEMMVFGQLVFILILKLIDSDNNSKLKAVLAFLMGISSGVGFWIQPTIVYFFIPAALVLLITRPAFSKKNRFLDWTLYLTIPGILVGALPVVICNLTGCAATVSSLINKGTDLTTTAWGSFYFLLRDGFPVLLGIRKVSVAVNYVSSLSLIVLAIYLFSFIFVYWARFKVLFDRSLARYYLLSCLVFISLFSFYFYRLPRVADLKEGTVSLIPMYILFSLFLFSFFLYIMMVLLRWVKNNYQFSSLDLILIFVYAVIIIFIFSPPFNGFVTEPRYVSPLYVALPIILAYSLNSLFQNRGLVSIFLKPEVNRFLAVIILSVLMLSNFVDYNFATPSEFLYQYRINNLITFLKDKNIKYIYADVDFAHRLSLETEMKIIAIPFDNYLSRLRKPEYEQMLKKAPNNEKALVTVRDKKMSVEKCKEDFAVTSPCYMVYYDGFYVYRW